MIKTLFPSWYWPCHSSWFSSTPRLRKLPASWLHNWEHPYLTAEAQVVCFCRFWAGTSSSLGSRALTAKAVWKSSLLVPLQVTVYPVTDALLAFSSPPVAVGWVSAAGVWHCNGQGVLARRAH
jgi:hypothetical protein